MSDNTIGKVEFWPVDPEAIREKRKKAVPEVVNMLDLVQQNRVLESTIASQAAEIERLRKACDAVVHYFPHLREHRSTCDCRGCEVLRELRIAAETP